MSKLMTPPSLPFPGYLPLCNELTTTFGGVVRTDINLVSPR